MVASLCESSSANFTISNGSPPHLFVISSFSFRNSEGMLVFKAWAGPALWRGGPKAAF